MTFVPRFNIPPGSEITLSERPVVFSGQEANGYRVTGLDDGLTTVLPHMKLLEYLKLPGVRIDTDLAMTGGRLARRLGGYATAQALPEEQRDMARFHLALCQAMQALRDTLRLEKGDRRFEPSDRLLDLPENRKFIADVASTILGKKVRVHPLRGGKSNDLHLYKGRTLNKYFRVFDGLEPHESPLDALVPLVHMRGNRNGRLCDRLRDLMTEAWEAIGLDLKNPAVSNVLKHLEGTILVENERRDRNILPKLVVPSHRTLREHRDRLLTPTEILVATHGLRHARNKRGRGSTDLRALLIGEVVEIDECRMSLVTSAKEGGSGSCTPTSKRRGWRHSTKRSGRAGASSSCSTSRPAWRSPG